MKQFEKKKDIKKVIYSKITILVLLFFVYTLSRGSYRIYQKYRMVNFREDQSIQALNDLANRKENLEREIDFLNSEVGREGLLRSHYSLTKTGERMILIIDEKIEDDQEVSDAGLFDKTKSWFRSINLLK